MSTFVSYKSYLQENVLNETYESYKELRILAQALASSELEEDSMQLLNNVVVSSKYKIIKEFIESGLGIIATTSIPNPASYASNSILAEHDKELADEFKLGLIVINPNDINATIILHELQHAWDDYVSKGKFTNTKLGMRYTDKAKKYIEQNKEDAPLPAEAMQPLYYRTPHEISSYFVQTIEKINFFENYGAPYKVLRNIHEVYEEFIKIYQGYRYLTPKDKKILARKFSQYYYKIKEEHENKKAE